MLCENNAFGEGVEKITVKSSLNAISYYEKLGFKREGDVQEHEGISYVAMLFENKCCH